MPKKVAKNKLEKEKIAQTESEVGSVDNPTNQTDLIDEEAMKGLEVEKQLDADQTTPAEVLAIKPEKDSQIKISSSKKHRSKSYHKAKESLEPGKLYSLKDAIELIKNISVSKYDGSVEIHLKLRKKKSKTQTESGKGVFNLPHGTGKEKKIITLNEDLIEEIAKTKKINFDIALASPSLMPKVAKIAKILGPKGKMPDPKSGTVTDSPEQVIKEINSGKVQYRIDSGNNIHQIVGRVSWDSQKLLENILVVFSTITKSKIESAFLTASVAPSIAIDLVDIK